MPPLQIMRAGSFSAPVTPPLSSPRLPYVKPDWPELSSKGTGDALADCAAAAFCNAWPQSPFLSGTSTPTHPSPSSFLVSGASTPSPFFASGTSTPTHPSVLPSGACTPTHPPPLRAVPLHFAAAAAAAANLSFHADASSGASYPPRPAQDAERPGNSASEFDKACTSGAKMDSKDPKLDRVSRGNELLCNGATSFQGAITGARGSFPNGFSDRSKAGWMYKDGEAEQAIRDLAAAVPDARIIVTESLRMEMEMEMEMNVARRRQRMTSLVKPWEGETIHEVSLGEEDLELTLGNSTTKGAVAPPEMSSRATSMSID